MSKIIKLSLLLYVGVAKASAPSVMTFQTKIISPSGTALEAASVNFRFTILDSAGTCVLYVEDYANVNMAGSQGIVAIPLGSGTKQYPPTATSMYEVFNNSAAAPLSCQAGGTSSPAATDNRQVVMQFNDGGGWQTLPQMAINAVPFANYATRAESLGAYTAADYLRPATLPTCTAGQALRWDGSAFTCITPAGGGGGSYTGVTSITNASGDITLAPAAGTGAVQINSGSASTSPSTGALIVSGGIGVSGGVYTGGAISSGSSISATTSMYTPQLYGTSTASGDIRVDGTSNATKGNVLLASQGGNVGIGTTTPVGSLSIDKTPGNVHWNAVSLMNRSFNNNKHTNISFLDGNNQVVAGMGSLYDNVQGTNRIDFHSIWNGSAKTDNDINMSILGNGRVGIGTTSPENTLTIVAEYPSIDLDGANFGTPSGTSSPNIKFRSPAGGGTQSSVTIGVDTGDDHKFKINRGNDFFGTPEFVINDSGLVGIGTTTPNALLHLNGGQFPIMNIEAGAAWGVMLEMTATDSGLSTFYLQTTAPGAPEGGGRFIIGRGHGVGALVSVSETGVGIGTTTPAAKLHVNGTITSGSNVIANGAAVDLSLSNTHVLQNLATNTITLSNMVNGGTYTLILQDQTSRTYSFAGCANTKFSPASAATTGSTDTIFDLTTVNVGGAWYCYVKWTSGFQ